MFLKWRDLAGSPKLKKTWFSLEMEYKRDDGIDELC
jgi:hypothetical protein